MIRALRRRWGLYLLAIGLSLLAGYSAAVQDLYSAGLVAVLILLFAFPVVLKWHHAALICCWNSGLAAFFLPGLPPLWLPLTAFSILAIALTQAITDWRGIRVPQMDLPLGVMTAIILVTAYNTGGIGIRSLGGGSYGGRYYATVLGAIAGYYAISLIRIPTASLGFQAGAFFSFGLLQALSNVIYFLGPSFFFLYWLVPADSAISQFSSDQGLSAVYRMEGFAPAATCFLCCLLMRYGMRGVLDFTQPWRFACFCGMMGLSLLAGFRSGLVFLILICGIQFHLERLWNWWSAGLIVSIFTGVLFLLFTFANDLPMSVQRSISFLPIRVSQEVKTDADDSLIWRTDMWKVVWREIPKYFWLGKGYSLDPAELYLTNEAVEAGILQSYEGAMLAGDYHNGLLSVLLPFGIFGLLTFLWMLGTGFWVLHCNFKNGSDRLRMANTVLLSYYSAYCISFFALFGSLTSQLTIFLGTVGLSVSLNAGVCRRHSVLATT